MDVHCTTCGEPVDTDYLWSDLICDTDLSEREAKEWESLPPERKLDEPYRQKFDDVGWVFGRTIINVIRCSACPKDAKADPELVRIKAELEDLFGGDQDGLAATFEDMGL